MRPNSEIPVKILMVSDNPLYQFIVSNSVNIGEEIFHIADSAVEATCLIEESFYSLIIIDPSMPHQSGFELTKFLKDGKQTTHIPVVFFSTKPLNHDYLSTKQANGSIDLIPVCSDINFLKGHLRTLIESAKYRRKILLEKNQILSELNKYKALIENLSPQYAINYNNHKKNPVTVIHENATVMIAGFANFESIAKQVNPIDLARRMDIYFQKLKEIIERYEMDKIYNIGGTFIAINGMQNGNAKSAVIMILAALEMQLFSNNLVESERSKEEHPLFFNCGISTGKIVSDILINRSFDIWGDAVSEAVGLKSGAEQSKIVISESTRGLVADTFELEPLHIGSANNSANPAAFEVRKIKESHSSEWADKISNQLYLP